MELKQVCGGYHGVAKVHDVSAAFPQGKITTLVGPNGSGKSTLLKLACGLLPRMGGEVWLHGRALHAYSRVELAQSLSFLSQTRSVATLPVRSLVLHGRFPYLGYPRRYKKEDFAMAQEAMAWVGIEGLAEKSMAEISGGERQKAYIAMLIAQNSDVVFMDEPTTYLDIGHQLDIMRLAERMRGEGKTVVMVLHDLGLALSYSDQIILLDQGRVHSCGSPDDVLRTGRLEESFSVAIYKTEIEGAGTAYKFDRKKVL